MGNLSHLEETKGRIAAELIDITRLEGLGWKRTKTLYHELGITNMQEQEEERYLLSTAQEIALHADACSMSVSPTMWIWRD